MRTPQPNAIAYEVTAKRPGIGGRAFRRCRRDFPLGVLVRVEASDLTEAQRAFLLNSDPRDLLVAEIVADLPQGEGVEAAAPAVDAPEATLEVDDPEQPAGELVESESDETPVEQDDQEPDDGAPAEGAASTTSPPAPALGRKKKGKRR